MLTKWQKTFVVPAKSTGGVFSRQKRINRARVTPIVEFYQCLKEEILCGKVITQRTLKNMAYAD